MSKKWYQSKTIWLSILIIAGGIAEYIAELPPGVSAATITAGVLGIIVRFLTTEPISRS